MKTSSALITLSIAFFITLGTVAGASVWTDTSTTYTDNWVSVSFINADTGWVASADGIVATRNGWNTWFASGGGIRAISEIQFVDENTGWYVADSGEIRHTSNGGLDWETQTSGTDHNLYDLFFLDNQTGWVVGDSVVLKTIDAGASWSELTTPANLLKFEDIYFVDNTHGWIVDQSSSRTDIFRTVDGGLTWSSSKGVGGNTSFFSVYFHDTLNGLVVGGSTYGRAKIYRTEDGGITWLPTWTPAYDASIPSARLVEVDFLDNQRGIAVGKYGSIAKTSDGGLNWVRDRIPNTGHKYLRGVEITTKSKAIAVGDNGRILSGELTFGPIVHKTPPIELNEDFSAVVIANLDTVFVDDDSPSVTYSVETNGLCTASISGSELTLESSANMFGESIVTVTAQDDDLNIGTLKLEWTIQSENDPPTIAGIPDATFLEDDSLVIQLDSYVGDVEDDPEQLLYSATVLGGNAANLTVQFNKEIYTWGEVNKVTLKPVPDSSGIFNVVFEMTDTEMAVGRDTVKVTVTPINDPPVSTTIDSVFTTEYTHFSFQGTAIDPDNPDLTWTWDWRGAESLDWLTASGDSIYGYVGDSGSASGRAISHYILVTVSDGENVIDFPFILTIAGNNNPPNPFELISPSDSSTLSFWESAGLSLKWEKSIDPESALSHYRVEVSDDLGWSFNAYENSYYYFDTLDTYLDSFPRNTWLYWDVYASDDSIETKSTKTFVFKIDDHFSLLSPPDCTYISYWGDRSLMFQWEHLAPNFRGVSYRVEVSDNNGWMVSKLIDQQGSLSMTLDEDFPRNTWLNWDVYAINYADEVKSAETFRFNINQVVGAEGSLEIPDEYSLNQNYPNPFNPITNIRYGLPEVADLSLIIFDLKGRIIGQWFAASQIAGWHELQWNGKDHSGNSVSTGVYFARLQTGDYIKTIKMVYLK